MNSRINEYLLVLIADDSKVKRFEHDCQLEGATKLGYVLINGEWYIEWVLMGDIYTGQSKTIKPIAVPSYLLSPKFGHPNKTPEDGAEPH